MELLAFGTMYYVGMAVVLVGAIAALVIIKKKQQGGGK